MTLKDLLKDPKKLVFGRNTVIKMITSGKLSEVILAVNAPDKKKIEKLATLVKTKITQAKETNEELGAICRKPFRISIIGIKNA